MTEAATEVCEGATTGLRRGHRCPRQQVSNDELQSFLAFGPYQ